MATGFSRSTNQPQPGRLPSLVIVLALICSGCSARPPAKASPKVQAYIPLKCLSKVQLTTRCRRVSETHYECNKVLVHASCVEYRKL